MRWRVRDKGWRRQHAPYTLTPSEFSSPWRVMNPIPISEYRSLRLNRCTTVRIISIITIISRVGSVRWIPEDDQNVGEPINPPRSFSSPSNFNLSSLLPRRPCTTTAPLRYILFITITDNGSYNTRWYYCYVTRTRNVRKSVQKPTHMTTNDNIIESSTTISQRRLYDNTFYKIYIIYICIIYTLLCRITILLLLLYLRERRREDVFWGGKNRVTTPLVKSEPYANHTQNDGGQPTITRSTRRRDAAVRAHTHKTWEHVEQQWLPVNERGRSEVGRTSSSSSSSSVYAGVGRQTDTAETPAGTATVFRPMDGRIDGGTVGPDFFSIPAAHVFYKLTRLNHYRRRLPSKSIQSFHLYYICVHVKTIFRIFAQTMYFLRFLLVHKIYRRTTWLLRHFTPSFSPPTACHFRNGKMLTPKSE